MPTTSKHDLELMLDEQGIQLRGTQLGEMAVGFEHWPKGDYGALFHGLPDDACQAEHWGYFLSGKARIAYSDGTSEVIEAGQAYHLGPGHTMEILEDVEVVEFTPVDATYERTVEVVEKNLGAFLATGGE